MGLNEDLRPAGRNRVIDLVRAAGAKVPGWTTDAVGESGAASNPKYCYEWSFVDPRGIVVLNLWYRDIEYRRDAAFVRLNYRALVAKWTRLGWEATRIRRAQRTDSALQTAATGGMLVRVILNDGDMKTADDPEKRASKVKARKLDPVAWAIRSYDVNTGDCVVERGSIATRVSDQFDQPDSVEVQRVEIRGTVFVRDSVVRAAARTRSGGRCEYCGTPGFITPSGEVFLETHHIVPLSDGGLDAIENVAAVCANHHREAHYGASAALIREFLLEKAARG